MLRQWKLHSVGRNLIIVFICDFLGAYVYMVQKKLRFSYFEHFVGLFLQREVNEKQIKTHRCLMYLFHKDDCSQ